MAAGSHAGLLGHARAVALVALHVALVGEGLLGVHGHVGHVAAGHVALGHARAAGGRGDVRGRLLGRVGGVATVDAVFAAGGGLGGVEAGLGDVSDDGSRDGTIARAAMGTIVAASGR